ncbi:MAG: insulinase family protein, partial [Kofleriaceae bacterium]
SKGRRLRDPRRDPHGVFSDRHPYGVAAATPDTVLEITRDQACAFADLHYVPGNAVLVVSGPIDPASVQRTIRQALAAVPRRPLPPPRRPLEPSPPGATRTTAPIDDPALVVAWPLATDPDTRARVRALAAILADHVSRELRGTVSVQELGGVRASLIALVVVPARDEPFANAGAEIKRQIAELPTSFDNQKHYDDSFEHAQRTQLYERYARLDDGGGRDTDVADEVLANRDPHASLAAELHALATLERTAASKLARATFRLDAARILVVQPASSRRSGRRVEVTSRVPEEAARDIVDDPLDARRPAPPLTPDAIGSRTTSRTLANGMRVVLLPLGATPAVQIRVVIAAGAGDEPEGARGVASLAAHALLPAQSDLAEVLDFYTAGGSFERRVGLDHTTFAVRGLERDLDLLLVGTERLLRNGDYREAPAVLERMRVAAAAVSRDAGATAVWRTALYGTHAYAAAGQLQRANLDALNEHAAGTFRVASYRPDRTTIIISGGFDPALADRWIDHLFGTWIVDAAVASRSQARARLSPATLARLDDTSLVAITIAIPVEAKRERALLLTELVDQAVAEVRHHLGASYSLGATLEEARGATRILITGFVSGTYAGPAAALINDRLTGLATLDDATASQFVSARRRLLLRLAATTTSGSELADRAERAAVLGAAGDRGAAEVIRTLVLDDLAAPLQGLDFRHAAILLRGPREHITTMFEAFGRPEADIVEVR